MLSQPINFKVLFNTKHLQAIQDEFAHNMEVASLITLPNGVPVTGPSNFSRLCMNVIRNTPKGSANCLRSDAIVGRFNKTGPTIQLCLSGGLWDTGTSISVGNIHIGTWLIGQVMNEAQDICKMMDYARQIGADVDEFSRELSSVKVMDKEKFVYISEALFLFSRYLSAFAESILENKMLDGTEGRKRLIAIIEKEPDLAKLYPIWDEMQILFNYSVH